ncbi:hypothetical protein GCM10009107_16990 [Ideonella azotifigens]|uniref:Uncharacterized protein n=1 Tax=Ideonella azotifigens TaxID=513160 RepID=A0ABN1JWB2_9BURK
MSTGSTCPPTGTDKVRTFPPIVSRASYNCTSHTPSSSHAQAMPAMPPPMMATRGKVAARARRCGKAAATVPAAKPPSTRRRRGPSAGDKSEAMAVDGLSADMASTSVLAAS